MPPHVLVPQWEKSRQYEEYFRSGFLGPEYDPMAIPDPARKDFQVADLSLPKSVSEQAVAQPAGVSQSWWTSATATLYKGAEHANMDGFTAQAWKMLLNPAVQMPSICRRSRTSCGTNTAGTRSDRARCWRAGWWNPERVSSPPPDFTAIPGTPTPRTMKGIATGYARRSTARSPLCSMISNERGLLESTVVLAMGEFGRTPFVNPDLGRDHWPTCWSLALGGGGIKGGQVIGASDENGRKRGQPRHQHGRCFRDHLQGVRNRLDERVRHADRPADQDRELSGRRDGQADSGTAVS